MLLIYPSFCRWMFALLPLLGCCHVLQWTQEFRYSKILLSVFCGANQEAGLLNRTVVLFLLFLGNPRYSFPWHLYQFTFPPGVTRGFQFINILTRTFVCLFLWPCPLHAEFPGPGVKPSHSSNSAGSFTDWATRELRAFVFWCVFLYSCHPDVCEIISNCGFDLCVSND